MIPGALIAFVALQPHADFVHHDFDFPEHQTGWQAPTSDEVLEAMQTRHADGELLELRRISPVQVEIIIKNPTSKVVPVHTNAWPYLWLEAKLDGEWRALEYFMPVCGNGAMTEFLTPSQSATSDFRYLPGSYQSQMRVAMHLGEKNTVYSKPIPTSLHKSMFSPEPDSRNEVTISLDNEIPMLEYTKKSIKP